MKSLIMLQQAAARKTTDGAKQEQLVSQALGQNVRGLVAALALNTEIAQTQAGAAMQGMGQGLGFLKENAEKVRETLNWSVLIAQIQVMAVTIGEALLPVLMPLFQVIGSGLKIIGAWAKENQTMIPKIASFLGTNGTARRS